MVSVRVGSIVLSLLTSVAVTPSADAQSPRTTEDDFYRLISVVTAETTSSSRSKDWRPGDDGPALEVSGLEVLPNGKVAVAIRKGEIWLLDNVYEDPPTNVGFHRFATALHEPLGLLCDGDDAFYTVQRSELTRVADLDGDQVADEYRTIAKGWGVTGHYHEYAYGPERDVDGDLWLTLNIGLGLKGEQLKRTVLEPSLGYRQGRWRGWGMKVSADGKLQPVCAGMRSPSGLGANAVGDMFYTDQQGNWVATNSLHHMRPGAFYHHAEALASMHLPGSTIEDVKQVPNGLPYPDAMNAFPQLRPPAVWFPYKKAGQSATDIVLDSSGGKFGPFAGQLFVGEFTQAAIHRVFLEQVNGEYQGTCFPFRSRFASAVLRLAQGDDGSLFAGLTNRGWSSLGDASYGLQRLVWTGRVPFEMQEVHAEADGFTVRFTKPVDRETAGRTDSWQLSSHTYLYHSTYGSDEIQKRRLTVQRADVSEDGLSVRLRVAGLRELFVHEIHAPGVTSMRKESLLHPFAWYTLNQIPDTE